MGKLHAVVNLFKPVPYPPQKHDKTVIAKEYAYWRIRIFYSMYIGYIFYYFSRKSFTFAMPTLLENLHYQHAELGILFTVLNITYGISKFTSGALSDRCNPRYFMALGLILTGVFNICFGLSSSIVWFALFSGLNGWFQGWGWPPVTKQLTHWYGRAERGTWWSVCSSSHNVGGFLISILGAYWAQHYGWRVALYLPGIICILAGIFLFERMRDTPRSLGLPSIEIFQNEGQHLEHEISKVDERFTIKQILMEHVLNNKYVWALAISYFFVYIVRTAINDWSMLYLVAEKNYEKTAAGLTVSAFEVGGFLGTIVAGWGSDFFFKGKRTPYMLMCAIALLIVIPAFWYIPAGYMKLDICMLALIGFFVFGPQMLAGLAAAEMVDKKASGTSNGFAGLFGYLGAACAGYPLGKVIGVWGWYGFFFALTLCSFMVLAILLPLWSMGDTPPESPDSNETHSWSGSSGVDE